jgi:hypothetical protein
MPIPPLRASDVNSACSVHHRRLAAKRGQGYPTTRKLSNDETDLYTQANQSGKGHNPPRDCGVRTSTKGTTRNSALITGTEVHILQKNQLRTDKTNTPHCIKLVPVHRNHAMTAYEESGGKAPHIQDFVTKCSASRPTTALYTLTFSYRTTKSAAD